MIEEALATVRDPELDAPITELGFVSHIAENDGEVEVELRLPTYFCAPNFAYLMVADAYDAVAAVPGVKKVVVRLEDHFASDEINSGVAASRGFEGSFPGLADGELEELRRTFRRKAHRACQEQVASRLLKAGWTMLTLADTTLGEARAALTGARLGEARVAVTATTIGEAEAALTSVRPAGEARPSPGALAPPPSSSGAASAAPEEEQAEIEFERLRRRRAELGLSSGPEAALLVQDDGTPITAVDLPLQLRMAKTTRISIEGNSGLCRGLLSVRYGLPRPPGVDQAAG
ncbi:iron-sulfur cluster assembly protein [Kribbella lupini]|uniref:MIP18 family-like domain-containing protein n=1 Tax=Kribbella lupini TaxID=291602 RepID=A0ABP4KXH0_9ACTN